MGNNGERAPPIDFRGERRLRCRIGVGQRLIHGAHVAGKSHRIKGEPS
jgi:hypothetical protein